MSARRRSERPPRGMPAPLGGPTNGSAANAGPSEGSRPMAASCAGPARWRRRGGGGAGLRAGKAVPRRRRPSRASGTPGGRGKAARGRRRRRPRPALVRTESSSGVAVAAAFRFWRDPLEWGSAGGALRLRRRSPTEPTQGDCIVNRDCSVLLTSAGLKSCPECSASREASASWPW